MSNYAYKDNERKLKIYATEIDRFDDTRYYCPNPKCDAEMYLCVNNGNNTSYFSANRKGHKHIPNCWGGAKNTFDKDEYNETEFSFDELMTRVLGNGNQNINQGNGDNHQNNRNNHNANAMKVIRSVRNLYLVCKTLTPNERYNTYLIEDMLVDDRVKTRYSNGFEGNKLVECSIPSYFYNRSERQLLLRYERITIVLNFNDLKLLNEFIDKIFSLRVRNRVAVVAGDWRKIDNQNIETTIVNKKQIWLRNY